MRPLPGLGFAAADFGGGRKTVTLWHFAIHQDQIEHAFAPDLQCLFAIDREFDFIAHLAQQDQAQFLIDQIVFHQQHAGARRSRGGRRHCWQGALGDAKRQQTGFEQGRRFHRARQRRMEMREGWHTAGFAQQQRIGQ